VPGLVQTSYVPMLWASGPVLADMVSRCLPRSVGPVVLLGHILPWIVWAQFLVLGADFLVPLSGRSGTNTIPGDVVVAAVYGWYVGTTLTLSARYLGEAERRVMQRVAAVALGLGVGMAWVAFPYSADRPKRLFVQHVERSYIEWTTQNVARVTATETGLLTSAIDWNGIGTVERHAPFGLPNGSEYCDASLGLYGRFPHLFPVRDMLAEAAWAPAARPPVPTLLDVGISRQPLGEGLVNLTLDIRGHTHIMFVIGPRAQVVEWSYGLRIDKWASGGGLPPPRPDCDCLFVFSAGTSSENRTGAALSNWIVVREGMLQLDVWTMYLKQRSPELTEYLARLPAWVDGAGWCVEMQLHSIQV